MIAIKLIASFLFLNCVFDSKAHHLREHILNHYKQCNICHISWVPYLQDYPIPNQNARICRVMKDRYIVGELQLDRNRTPFCKIPYFNKANSVYQFEVLNVNGKEIRELSVGNVNDLPGNIKSNELKTKCTQHKLQNLLEKIENDTELY